MAKQLGRELLVKIRTTTGPDVFTTLCGLTTKTMTINTNEIDITTADCTTPGSVLWTEVLGGAKRVTVSGNGFFEDSATEATLNTLALTATPSTLFQIVVPAFGTFAGSFMVTSLEFSGEQEGGTTYSLSLASTGAVTFTVLV